MPDFTIRRGDTAPAIKAQLLEDNGEPVDLSQVHRVIFEMESKAREVRGKCKIVDRDEGRVKYQWQSDDTRVARDYDAHFVVEFHDGRKLTVPNTGDLFVRVK